MKNIGKRPPKTSALCGEPLVKPVVDALDMPGQKLRDAIDGMRKVNRLPRTAPYRFRNRQPSWLVGASTMMGSSEWVSLQITATCALGQHRRASPYQHKAQSSCDWQENLNTPQMCRLNFPR